MSYRDMHVPMVATHNRLLSPVHYPKWRHRNFIVWATGHALSLSQSHLLQVTTCKHEIVTLNDFYLPPGPDQLDQLVEPFSVYNRSDISTEKGSEAVPYHSNLKDKFFVFNLEFYRVLLAQEAQDWATRLKIMCSNLLPDFLSKDQFHETKLSVKFNSTWEEFPLNLKNTGTSFN